MKADGNLLFQLTYDYAGEFAKVKTALEHISDSLNTTLTRLTSRQSRLLPAATGSFRFPGALSQGATEQASSIEELAATINDISQQSKPECGKRQECKQAGLNRRGTDYSQQ